MDVKKKSKKGEVAFLAFMLGVIILILSFSFAPTLVKNSDQVRESMDCNNASISTSSQVACSTVDISTPFIIGIVIGIGGLIFTSKILFGG